MKIWQKCCWATAKWRWISVTPPRSRKLNANHLDGATWRIIFESEMPLNKMCWVRKSQCGFLEVVRSVSWSITSESISNRVLGSEKHWHRAILTTLYLYPRDLFDVDDPLDSYAYEDNAARRSLEINRDLTVTVHFDWAELFFFLFGWPNSEN